MFKLLATVFFVLVVLIITVGCGESSQSNSEDSTAILKTSTSDISKLKESIADSIPALPAMYIGKEHSGKWKQEFKKNPLGKGSKYAILKAATKFDNVKYQFAQKSFADLIVNKLKIKEDSEDSVYVDLVTADSLPRRFSSLNIPKGKILLLYSRSEIPGKRTADNYFFLNESAQNVFELTSGEAQSMRRDFDKRILPNLDKTVVLSHDDNLNTINGIRSDTKNLQYQGGDFYRTFVKEKEYQASRGKAITHVEVFLAAYTKDGYNSKKVTNDRKLYKHRLIALFDLKYRDQSGNLISLELESEGDYNARVGKSNLIKSMLDFDKGHLCPDNCPEDDKD
jgi:hypothetical protein